jgi:hypothetical protein
MKLVPVLSGLLLVTLAALATTIIAARANGRLLADDDGGVGPAGSAPDASLLTVVGSTAGQACLNEVALRRIIREELATHPVAVAASQNPPESNAAAAPASPADSKRQYERVNQQVDNYIRAGAISQADMAALQGEIGLLDKAGQHEMLGKIVRAINSGALDGRL